MNIFENKINITICFSALFILGVLSFFTQSQIVCMSFVCAFIIYMLCSNKVNYKMAFVMLFAFICGFYISDLRVKDVDNLFYIAPKNNVVLKGQIVSILENNKPDRTRFYFKANEIQSENIKINDLNSKVMITLFEPKEVYSKIQIGDTLLLKGNLRTPQKASNPSEFDYAKYLQYENTFSTFFVQKDGFEIISKPDTSFWKFLQNIDNQRNLIIQKHAQVLKSPYIELLGGVVFGDDAINPTESLKESFKISGLLHLLAASGLNVGLIFTIWFFIGSLFKLNYRVNIITGAMLVAVYTCMTGFSPSILRATLMIEFILLGKLIDRQADNLALISFVCFLMLLYHPAWVYSVSFQLSFLVTAGLILTMPPITDFCSQRFNKFVRYSINTICVPIVAQIWALPLQMYYFNTFSAYSVIANICVLPFITVVSFVGFVSSVLALIPFLPDIVIKICDMFLSPFLIITVKISNFVSALPHANFITIQPNAYQVFVYYFVILLILKFFKDKNKKLLYVIFIAIFAFALSFIKCSDNNLHLTFFSVKNADSCLIKTPKKHYIIIDTGKKSFNNTYSQGDGIIAKYLLSKGIKKIDFVILSHLDNDHIGGTIGLLQKIKVKKVYVNSDIQTTQTSKELFEYFKNNNIPYEIVKNNSILYEEDDLILNGFLNKSIDENENSIINLLTYKKINALFMGDAGTLGYSILPKNIEIDVLKLGHHGAQGTIDKNTLTKIKPKTVIVSTGKNQYGHPHYSIIDLLIETNTNFIRTDEKNAVDISSDGNSISEKCYSTKKKKFTECKL